MICKCGGTGFVSVVGKYRSNYTGTVYDGVIKAQRCPAFLSYWDDLKEFCHISDSIERKKRYSILASAKVGSGCDAAVKAHQQLQEHEHDRETKRRDRV